MTSAFQQSLTGQPAHKKAHKMRKYHVWSTPQYQSNALTLPNKTMTEVEATYFHVADDGCLVFIKQKSASSRTVAMFAPGSWNRVEEG